VIGVFLGILELCRLRRVKFEQARQFGEIYLMLGEEGDSEIELPDDAEMGYVAADTAEPPADAQAAQDADSTAEVSEDAGQEEGAADVFGDEELGKFDAALDAIEQAEGWESEQAGEEDDEAPKTPEGLA